MKILGRQRAGREDWRGTSHEFFAAQEVNLRGGSPSKARGQFGVWDFVLCLQVGAPFALDLIYRV